MESSYSPSVIQDALDRLDQQDVIELIDYRPEMMQRAGDSIRCFCPIHNDTEHRSLTISLNEKTFSCADPVCPGSKGGSLIELYALARGTTFDDALKALADEFGFALLRTTSSDSLRQASEEAMDLLERADKEPRKRDQYHREAEQRLRTVLSVQPENVPALLGLYRILKEYGNFLELGQLVGQLLILGERSNKVAESMALAREYLELNPVDIEIRSRVADYLIKLDQKEDAVAELMALADTAEQSNQLEAALAAYQRIARMRTDIIDVHPMIVNLMVALKRPADAARQIIGRANWLREHEHYRDAAETLLNVLDVEPENVAVRFEAVKLFVLAGLDEKTTEECITLTDGIQERNEGARHLKALRLIHQALPDNVPVLERLSVAERLNGYSATAKDLEAQLAGHLLRLGNHHTALMLLEQLLADDPKDVRSLRLIADTYAAMGDKEAALEKLDEAAVIYQEAGSNNDLIAIAERAVAIDPATHTHRITLAELLEGIGQKDRAKEVITALTVELERDAKDAALCEALAVATRLEPDETRHLLRMADAYTRLGNISRAVDARMNAARSLMKQGRHDHAEAQLRQLLEEAPGTVAAQKLLVESLGHLGKGAAATSEVLNLVDSLTQKQNFHEAKEVLETLLKSMPENLEALTRLSDVCAELGDDDGFVDVLMRLVHLQTESRMYDLAIEQAEQVLQLKKEHDGALAALATLYELRGDRARMTEYMTLRMESLRRGGDRVAERKAVADLLARDPKNKAALERITFLDFETGERVEGLARLDEYLALATAAEGTQALRELLLRNPEEMGLHTRLIALLRRSGSRDDLASALQSLILVHERADSWRDAIAIHREVLQITPDSVISRVALVDALKRLGDRQAAITELMRLAELHERQANDDDALGVYEQAERLDPTDERAYRGQAEILKRRGRNDLAAGRLKALAETLLAQNRRADAIRILQATLPIDPSNRDIHRSLIALYVEEGRTEEAITDLIGMSDAALKEGDEEGHLSMLREAVGLRPADMELRRKLINALQECERTNEASTEAVSLAEALLAANQATDALKTLDDVIARQPDNLRARKIRAEIYLSQGEDKLALAEFRQMAPFLDRPGGSFSAAPAADVELQIMPEYVFETFVVGPRNNFAFATAKAVAKSPGTAYNPVFLYSDVGLGKTHLLHAIANAMRETNPQIRITYTNVEDFTAELIQSIELNNVAQFRQKHKSADVLLIDDIQFLAGKERSQEELFHIFNTLFQSKRQIVVTSDRPPKDLGQLEKRLKSRFGAGVVVDVQTPDIETRMAIVRKELLQKHSGITLPEDVVRALAERLVSNVRELKGALNQIVMAHELGGATINISLVQQTIDKLYAAQG